MTAIADQVNADGCTRSHPHENMSAECEHKTIDAKTANARRNSELSNSPNNTDAWNAVCEALNKHFPGWLSLKPTGIQSAVFAITELSLRGPLSLKHHIHHATKEPK